MNTTDSPAARVVMPLRGAARPKLLELSSIFQPVIVTGVGLALVSSNQSLLKGLFPLDQGATSETKRAGSGGVSLATSSTARLKLAVRSGVEPTVGSSTVTVTE